MQQLRFQKALAGENSPTINRHHPSWRFPLYPTLPGASIEGLTKRMSILSEGFQPSASIAARKTALTYRDNDHAADLSLIDGC